MKDIDYYFCICLMSLLYVHWTNEYGGVSLAISSLGQTSSSQR